MSFSGNMIELGRSMEFFSNTANYGNFWLNRHGQRAVGCIDPRDEDRPQLHVIVQTAGGAAGKAYDQALAFAADSGNGVDICAGIDYDSRLQRTTVATGHYACAFMNGLDKVNAEIANPSEMTKDSIARLTARYEFNDQPSFRKYIRRISDAAKRNQDVLDAIDADTLLEHIDEAYPNHENVKAMHGTNTAGIYIFNHHPYLGLNREKVHRGEEPLIVHAYHDSTRASIDSLMGTYGLPKDQKALRLAALVLRTVATPTVLVGDDKRINILHVVPTHTGFQVEQQAR